MGGVGSVGAAPSLNFEGIAATKAAGNTQAAMGEMGIKVDTGSLPDSLSNSTISFTVNNDISPKSMLNNGQSMPGSIVSAVI